MPNISTKINLLAIPGAKKMEVDGKKGKVAVVMIPIEYSNLYEGQKGIYLDLIGFDLKNPRPDSKDTHLVKQSLPKEKQTDNDPIIGNHIVWGAQAGQDSPAQVSNMSDDDGDLPF